MDIGVLDKNKPTLLSFIRVIGIIKLPCNGKSLHVTERRGSHTW